MNKLFFVLLLMFGMSSARAEYSIDDPYISPLGVYQTAANECYLVSKIWGGHIGRRTSCTASAEHVTVVRRDRYSIVREDGVSVVGTHIRIQTKDKRELSVDVLSSSGI